MLRVGIDLTGQKNHRLDFELTPQELSLIGDITAKWAFLEHSIFVSSLDIANQAGIVPPSEVTNNSFKKRYGEWKRLVRTYAPEDKANQFKALFGRIAIAEKSRHKVTHGLWNYNPVFPNRLELKSLRSPHEFSIAFDIEALSGLATELARIAFLLNYPNGPEQFYEEGVRDNEIFISASRSFLTTMYGRSSGDQ